MGVRNYLIEGVSGAGKTTVAEELERRGCHVIHGDRTLAYLGDPKTGAALEPPMPGGVTDIARWRHVVTFDPKMAKASEGLTTPAVREP